MHLCIIPDIPHPFFPISATFLQSIPTSFLPFPALFPSVPALLFPLLDHSFSFFLFLPVLATFPFIQVLLLFSKFDLLLFFHLFLPPSPSSLLFFPVHIPHFPALFHFPFYLSHLFHFYLLSSFFSHLSCSCPFVYAGHTSFSLFLSPLPTSHSH